MFGKRSTTKPASTTLAPQPAPMLEPAPRAGVAGGAAVGAERRRRRGGRPLRHPFGRPRRAAGRRRRRPASAHPEPSPPLAPSATDSRHSEAYYETKSTIFGALIEAIDLAQLAKLDADSAREEIRDIVNEIIAIKAIVMSISEQEELLDDICNDVLGYGPLEPLLARDDIADIMVNGSGTTYIEVKGKIQSTGIRFRDNQQLLNICQRIVSQIGRRVDESSPICDARLPDGSRVNVIVPPLAIDGPALTIRKFKKDKLTLDQLVKFGTITPEGAEILKVIGRCRVNTLVSGGTGSGKTTLLNCLTQFIDDDERIITCEDAAELQLQQPHTVRLETRPPNIEGEGQITMRDLVKNCLRMRPERIIVGEVRGPEAFDLLQAMNTGHDGSMGTLHANSPREALSRVESMITMGGYSLPSRTIREMLCGSIDVIVQAARLRDGSRRITHITEVMGLEGDVIITQDLFIYDMMGEDEHGNIIGRHRSTGIGRPRFWDRARYYGEEKRLAAALDAAEVANGQSLTTMNTQTIALFFLATVAIGGVAWVFIYPIAVGRTPGREAQGHGGAHRRGHVPARTARTAQKSRREQVEGSLKELEVRNGQGQIAAAGGAHQPGRADLVEAALLRHRRHPGRRRVCALHADRCRLAGGGRRRVCGAFGLPFWMLRFLKKRREAKFLAGFPDAVDIIVRGIKAGLPLLDCLRMITVDAAEPLKSEFRAIVETQAIGLPIGEACAKLYERIPLPEANFFGIVISIQQRAGGNLSEALGNLSKVLRERKKMKAKIQAMSMEAKASASIIACSAARRDDAGLPHAARTTSRCCGPSRTAARCWPAAAAWMSTGVLVMKKMINFDF